MQGQANCKYRYLIVGTRSQKTGLTADPSEKMTSTGTGTPTQHTDIIFVVEGTALCGAYLQDLKSQYIVPTLE